MRYKFLVWFILSFLLYSCNKDVVPIKLGLYVPPEEVIDSAYKTVSFKYINNNEVRNFYVKVSSVDYDFFNYTYKFTMTDSSILTIITSDDGKMYPGSTYNIIAGQSQVTYYRNALIIFDDHYRKDNYDGRDTPQAISVETDLYHNSYLVINLYKSVMGWPGYGPAYNKGYISGKIIVKK